MTRKRKHHNAKFKAKVALEALKGLKTSSEPAREFQAYPMQISQWKHQLLEMFTDLFRHAKVTLGVAEQELTVPLYEKIGRLKRELDWVKKCCQAPQWVSVCWFRQV